MKEQRCTCLDCRDGDPEKGIKAKAECSAKIEGDCLKSRAKFRITELCFRVIKKQSKKE